MTPLFQALLLYMYEALRGVKGFVVDEESGLPVSGAKLHVKGRERQFNTTDDGEYWRILLGGSYTLEVRSVVISNKNSHSSRFDSIYGDYIFDVKISAEGYEPQELPFQVIGDEATILNVTMRRLAVSFASPSSIGSIAVSVSETVADNLTRMTMSSLSDVDDSSGDGNHSTQHPIHIDSNNLTTWMTSTTDSTSLLDQTIVDDDDEGVEDDEDDFPSPFNTALQPKTDAVISRASSPLGLGFTTHSTFLLTTCTIVLLSRLTLNRWLI